MLRSAQRFRRIPERGWLGGVCAGIAYRLEAPTWLIRLLWALLFGYGFLFTLYILLWIFMPKRDDVPEDYDKVTDS
jgi:phage shock protein PspC (stress-responsive transcriptional regulator)